MWRLLLLVYVFTLVNPASAADCAGMMYRLLTVRSATAPPASLVEKQVAHRSSAAILVSVPLNAVQSGVEELRANLGLPQSLQVKILPRFSVVAEQSWHAVLEGEGSALAEAIRQIASHYPAAGVRFQLLRSAAWMGQFALPFPVTFTELNSPADKVDLAEAGQAPEGLYDGRTGEPLVYFREAQIKNLSEETLAEFGIATKTVSNPLAYFREVPAPRAATIVHYGVFRFVDLPTFQALKALESSGDQLTQTWAQDVSLELRHELAACAEPVCAVVLPPAQRLPQPEVTQAEVQLLRNVDNQLLEKMLSALTVPTGLNSSTRDLLQIAVNGIIGRRLSAEDRAAFTQTMSVDPLGVSDASSLRIFLKNPTGRYTLIPRVAFLWKALTAALDPSLRGQPLTRQTISQGLSLLENSPPVTENPASPPSPKPAPAAREEDREIRDAILKFVSDETPALGKRDFNEALKELLCRTLTPEECALGKAEIDKIKLLDSDVRNSTRPGAANRRVRDAWKVFALAIGGPPPYTVPQIMEVYRKRQDGPKPAIALVPEPVPLAEGTPVPEPEPEIPPPPAPKAPDASALLGSFHVDKNPGLNLADRRQILDFLQSHIKINSISSPHGLQRGFTDTLSVIWKGDPRKPLFLSAVMAVGFKAAEYNVLRQKVVKDRAQRNLMTGWRLLQYILGAEDLLEQQINSKTVYATIARFNQKIGAAPPPAMPEDKPVRKAAATVESSSVLRLGAEVREKLGRAGLSNLEMDRMLLHWHGLTAHSSPGGRGEAITWTVLYRWSGHALDDGIVPDQAFVVQLENGEAVRLLPGDASAETRFLQSQVAAQHLRRETYRIRFNYGGQKTFDQMVMVNPEVALRLKLAFGLDVGSQNFWEDTIQGTDKSWSPNTLELSSILVMGNFHGKPAQFLFSVSGPQRGQSLVTFQPTGVR